MFPLYIIEGFHALLDLLVDDVLIRKSVLELKRL
jgi:hypothetical protein